MSDRARTHGMVLGKFLPPHAGHVYLCEVARRWVDDLTIVVGTLAREPIPGELRAAWMRELFPFDRVVHLTDENPQDPSEQPNFWDIWRASLLGCLPRRPDLVFASEPYGEKLAEVLGARFVMVDPARSAIAISGTKLRADPIASWGHIPRCVRPYYVKRVSIFGPESTGKTTLAGNLARALSTVWVPEWARGVLERRGGVLEGLDWSELIVGQVASEEALAREARQVLVCDTDPLATVAWADAFGVSLSEESRHVAQERRYDLTLLLAPDVRWVSDSVRYLPDGGQAFFDRCQALLRAVGRNYVVIHGDWEERLAASLHAIGAMLAPARV